MQIEIALTTFYAKGDERRFFQGLTGIAAINDIQGKGRGLALQVDLRLLSKESLMELVALLWRYGIPLEPLRIPVSYKRFSWLGDKQWYWHRKMFNK